MTTTYTTFPNGWDNVLIHKLGGVNITLTEEQLLLLRDKLQSGTTMQVISDYLQQEEITVILKEMSKHRQLAQGFAESDVEYPTNEEIRGGPLYYIDGVSLRIFENRPDVLLHQDGYSTAFYVTNNSGGPTYVVKDPQRQVFPAAWYDNE